MAGVGADRKGRRNGFDRMDDSQTSTQVVPTKADMLLGSAER